MRSFPDRKHFRDRRHFVVASASEIIAPLLRLAARAASRGGATPPHDWRRALIVGHGHIGDVLYQTVSLGSLASGLPHCEFDYLTSEVGAEVLAGNPALTRILPWDPSPERGGVTRNHIATLRAACYDAIICTNLVRHQEGLLLGLRLGIPNRVAFTHRGLTGMTTLPVRLSHPMTPAQQSRVMAETITGEFDTTELRPRIFPTAADAAAAMSELERLGLSPTETILACSITTRQVVGRIPPEFFARILAATLQMDPAMRIVLCGSAEDEPNLRDARRRIPGNVAISCGRMSVRTYAAFLHHCSAFFGMDSGPRHLANAAGIPVVFVRNLAARATEAGCYCPTEVDVAPPGDYVDAASIAREIESVSPLRVSATILSALRAGSVRSRS